MKHWHVAWLSLVAAEASSAALAVVEPSTPAWPYLLLAALVSIGIGAIVLRVKRPELFSRVAREAAREKASITSLHDLFHHVDEQARSITGLTPTMAPPPTTPHPISNDGILR